MHRQAPDPLQAAARGDWNALRRALDAGGDANARDEQGVTLLMHAVRHGDDLEIVRYLVERGADIHARDRAGRSVRDYLALPTEPPEEWENEHEAWRHSEEFFIRDYLEGLGCAAAPREPAVATPASPGTPPAPSAEASDAANAWDWMLFAAIQRGSVGDLEGILATDKVNVNARDGSGWTPLMRAAAADSTEMVRLLLRAGADPSLGDGAALTAAAIAGPKVKALLSATA